MKWAFPIFVQKIICKPIINFWGTVLLFQFGQPNDIASQGLIYLNIHILLISFFIFFVPILD